MKINLRKIYIGMAVSSLIVLAIFSASAFAVNKNRNLSIDISCSVDNPSGPSSPSAVQNQEGQ